MSTINSKRIIFTAMVLGVLFTWSMDLAHSQDVGVQKMLATFERVARQRPEVAGVLSAAQKSFVVVFVPGILGSKLTDRTTGKVIWGEGLPDTDDLALPEPLIDEDANSDIDSDLLREYLWQDFYGEAFDRITAAANRLGARAVSCGYDWRRDIRSGARELEACIANATSDTPSELILIAHSMGGLVVTAWNQEYERGTYGRGHRVVAIALLGSPLLGSCEILRMVETGYVQPTMDDTIPKDEMPSYAFRRIEAWFAENVKNRLSAFFSDSVRRLVLSWPGAVELSPSPATKEFDRVCVLQRVADDSDPNVVSYYEPSFWTAGVGKQLLDGHSLPPTLTKVLAKAREFRTKFQPRLAEAPVYLYFSTFWHTPEWRRMSPGNRLAATGWLDASGGGDGRVPNVGARPQPEIFAEFKNILSVHGALPNDARFHEDFLDRRMPMIIRARVVAQLLERFLADDVVLATYVAAGGPVPLPVDFWLSFENPSSTDREPLAPATRQVLAMAERFAKALCDIGACETYGVAKAFKDQNVEKPDFQMSIGFAFAGTIARSETSEERRAISYAQVGLARMRHGDFESSRGALSVASRRLDSVPDSFDRKNPQVIPQLKRVVNVNLARTLYLAGRCNEARGLIEAATAAELDSFPERRQPCEDRESGRLIRLVK
jgi:pimeloyl-ACP methyl ester carboxylesterase